ncbi:PREDICTED: UDP-glucose iridoid glucosyltransferase-like [Fragaria vesca subsp. vesca]|uniref:UDP-glucose iridoid glucosyltransferase-like n=1 Tax=Fragaria vesca subsp. vesca TaxID=101020 RepID=UPI0002C334F7|nr:PREDICTED: UDP-glucose iridoid glucosyltransferase-like [Fragaria vesca subsp. vesca]
MEHQQERCRRVVLVPLPFQGHITPMLQLGTILHSKGFHITIAHTQFNFPNTLKYPHFDFIALSDGVGEQTISAHNFIAVISAFNTNCKDHLRESLARMMEKEDQHNKTACIIYDEYMYFAEEVAKQLRISSIILSTSSAAKMLSYLAIPRLQNEGHIPLQDSKMLELVPGLEPLRFKDLTISYFRKLDDLLQLIANALDPRSSSSIIWNTMDCLEHSTLAKIQQEHQLPLFPLGPLHKMVPAISSSLLKEDQRCIPWLDKQSHSSVIYISLGSAASMDNKDLVEMAWGLANSEQPFLWVIRTDSRALPEAFQEAVGDRGCIVRWAPQKEVLAHTAVGGFWSHCGWNSTIESISEGVPLICQPYYGDQRVNARYLTQVWGVGLEWENDMNRGDIEGAIRRLMVGKEGELIRQRAKDLKDTIKSSMNQGGSSYNSLNELVDLILSF